MCQEADSAYVKLYLWCQAPDRNENATNCDSLGGHLALEVKHKETIAYLGWWPSYYTVCREPVSGWKKLARQCNKIPRRIFQYGFWHQGRLTKYPVGSLAPAGESPDIVDGVLVGNSPLGVGARKQEGDSWEEIEPIVFYLVVNDIHALLSHVQQFNRAPIGRYQYILNNCASVCVSALKEGGL